MADISTGAMIVDSPTQGRCALFPGLAGRRIGEVSPLDNPKSEIVDDCAGAVEVRMDHAMSAATAEKFATRVAKPGATE